MSLDFLNDKQKAKLKEKILSGELHANSPEIKQLVIKRFEDDPLAFARHFLPDHLTDPVTGEITDSPQLHHDMIALYASSNRTAAAAPRGHAKTTVSSFFLAMHSILYEKKNFVVIVSQTERMASSFLRRLKDELEHNERIRWIFGEQKTDKWSESEFQINNGASVIALGRGGQVRGLLRNGKRPDLIICDDIEDDELVLSEIRRHDLESWFNSALLPSLEPKIGQLVFVGTILHMDSLLNRLLNPEFYPDFTTRKWSALDENDVPLWPERFDKETLLKIKESYISRSQLPQFFMEYMNDPIPVESAVFRSEYFTYFEDLPPAHKLQTEIYIDLGGGGASKSADPTAMVVISVDDKNNFFINDYVNDRMGTDTKKLFDKLFELNHKYKPSRIVIEKGIATNMIQSALEGDMRKRGIYLNIDYLSPTRGVGGGRRGNMSEGKFQRIATMEAAFKVGGIKMRKWMTEMQEQLLVFPRGRHDDLIDALSYGWMFFERRLEIKERDQGDLLFGRREEFEYEPIYPGMGL